MRQEEWKVSFHRKALSRRPHPLDVRFEDGILSSEMPPKLTKGKDIIILIKKTITL